MGSINRVLLMGRVGVEPELRTIKSGATDIKAVRFRLATSERYKDNTGRSKEHTEWHTCECYGQEADVAEKCVRKGQQLTLEGKLHTDHYHNRMGEEKYFTFIKVTRLALHDKG
jgi:single-strand DNA-binding protein